MVFECLQPEYQDKIVRVARDRELVVVNKQIAEDLGAQPVRLQKRQRRPDIDSVSWTLVESRP